MAKQKVPFFEASREGDTIKVHQVKRADPPQARELMFYFHLKEDRWVPSVPGYNPVKHSDDENALLKAIILEVDVTKRNPTKPAEVRNPPVSKRGAKKTVQSASSEAPAPPAKFYVTSEIRDSLQLTAMLEDAQTIAVSYADLKRPERPPQVLWRFVLTEGKWVGPSEWMEPLEDVADRKALLAAAIESVTKGGEEYMADVAIDFHKSGME